MKAKRVIFILLVLFLYPVMVMAADKGDRALPLKEDFDPAHFEVEEPERKDPFVAGVLSWSWNGLGHFYTQDYKRGSFFLVADIAQKGLLVYMIFHYSDKYTSEGDDTVKWNEMTRRDRGMIIGLVFSMLALKIASVVDAVNSAERYNRDVYFPYWKDRKRVRFSLDADKDRINVGITHSFHF